MKKKIILKGIMILFNIFFLKLIFTILVDTNDFYQFTRQLPKQKITSENGKYYLECSKKEFDAGFRNIYVGAIAFYCDNSHSFDTKDVIQFLKLTNYFSKNLLAHGVDSLLHKNEKTSFTQEEIFNFISEQNKNIVIPNYFLKCASVTKKSLKKQLKKYNTFKLNLSKIFEDKLKFLFEHSDINTEKYILFKFHEDNIEQSNAILASSPIKITKLGENKFEFKLIHFNNCYDENKKNPDITQNKE